MNIDWVAAITKALAQAGAMGAVVSLALEHFRGLVSVRVMKLLILIASIGFVHFYEAYPLGALGLQTPNHWLGVIFNGLIVAGAAKGVNDGMNAVDRMGDRK